MTGEERASWELAEGDAIAPGRTVLRRLGGGNLYEVYLVWDELLLAICEMNPLGLPLPSQLTMSPAARGSTRKGVAVA